MSAAAITSIEQVTQYPLCWPPTKQRTAARQKSAFKATTPKALALIEEEMRRWRAPRHVVSMAPLYLKGAVDPGAAVWFELQPNRIGAARQLRVLACDTYTKIECNLWAIGRTLVELRAIDRWGAYSTEQAVEGARVMLPPPGSVDWHTIINRELGARADEWPTDAIEALGKQKLAALHPDRESGDEARFKTLNEALAAMRKERKEAAGA